MAYLVRVELRKRNGVRARTTLTVDAQNERQAELLGKDRGRVIWVRDAAEDGWQDVTPEDNGNGGS